MSSVRRATTHVDFIALYYKQLWLPNTTIKLQVVALLFQVCECL